MAEGDDPGGLTEPGEPIRNRDFLSLVTEKMSEKFEVREIRHRETWEDREKVPSASQGKRPAADSP
jgi:hypothetical protein